MRQSIYKVGTMSAPAQSPQPDQDPDRWNDHVSVYQDVFEPLSLAFARAAFDAVGIDAGSRVLDVGAGSGGAALELAGLGCQVTAVDASTRMVAHLLERARRQGLAIDARVADGQALPFDEGLFDHAISIFGVILFPDAVRGLAEMRRVVRPGGRVGVVTWTEPQNYELATTLRTAIQSVLPTGAPATLPAQLRFRERDDFQALFRAAGFEAVETVRQHETLVVPSARWLGERLRFAPGMAAQLDALGDRAPEAVRWFVDIVEHAQGTGKVSFGSVAFLGTATRA
jgi:ubiquinone/menaquinone biosynthesis C-methylase UbiE